MLITHSFVMLNMPKTGSTFVRTAIKEIYEERRKNAPLTYKLLKKIKPLSGFVNPKVSQSLFIKELKFTTSSRLPKNQHGYYCQIPAQYQDKEVASVIRNPYDRFLSIYKFRWWAEHPNIDKTVILENLPNYPDLSLDEFVDLLNLYDAHVPESELRNQNLGTQTNMFLRMFSKNPSFILKNIDSLTLEEILSGIADITLLRQEELTQELADFLTKHSFSQGEVSYVKSKKKIHASRKNSDDGKELWTPKALTYVRDREKLLFEILEKLGISYSSSEYEQTIQPIL